MKSCFSPVLIEHNSSVLNSEVYSLLVGNLVITQVYPEGTHLMIPWFERPVIYDVRARPYLVESTSGSRDLQMVLFSTPPIFSRFILWI